MANTTIQLKYSVVTSNAPSSLANGEIAINGADGKLFYRTPGGTIQSIVTYPGPAGLNKEIQFNDAGTAGANAGLTFDKSSASLNVTNINVTNRVDWPAAGYAPPSFTTRSVGTKLTVYPALSGSSVDYAIGINGGVLWTSVPEYSASYSFKWYGGDVEVATLSGTGQLTTATANIISTTASTSNTTGALTVSGGVGVKGNVYAGAFYSGGTELLTFAQAAYNKANTAASDAATASTTANTALSQVGAAYNQANSAYALAQTAIDTATAMAIALG